MRKIVIVISPGAVMIIIIFTAPLKLWDVHQEPLSIIIADRGEWPEG